MLRNPPASDWPMLRRDQAASNFSPLNQITRDNAHELQLVWVAPMAEGGTNQPSPLAHNGAVFLNNSNGTIQALDGKTGDLDLGAAPRREPGDARHVALRRQAVSGAQQRAPGGARRRHRQAWPGTWRCPTAAAAPADRSRQGQGHPGHGRLLAVRRAEVLHQRLRRRHRQAALEVPHRGQGRRARRQHLGRADRASIAPAARPGSPAATTPT